MKENDVYFWSYKDVKDKFMPYHCKSGKAIFSDGRLRDTFWHGYNSSNSSWTCAEAEKELELEFKGNISDYELVNSSNVYYYNSKDYFSMAHSNNSIRDIFLKKGAKKDADVIKSFIQENIDNLEYRIKSAQRNLQEQMNLLADINYGKNLDEVYISKYEAY